MNVAKAADAARRQSFVEEAQAVLALWEQTHDWSRRRELYGAESGYRRGEAAIKSSLT